MMNSCKCMDWLIAMQVLYTDTGSFFAALRPVCVRDAFV